jgi:group I intron endonuclease
MRRGSVYVITNLENGMQYIGSTFRELKYRWNLHIHAASKTVTPLGQDILRFGRKAFSIQPIATCWGKEALLVAEAELTESFNTLAPNGYNRSLGARHSEATKRKMFGRVTWQKGKPSKMRGVPRSPETKQKISESQKCRPPRGIEWRQKISASKTGAQVLKKRVKVIDQFGTVYGSIGEAAQKIGVSISMVSMALNGKRSRVRNFLLTRLEE